MNRAKGFYMKFDANKVQTMVTADTVKVGSKGFFGDTLKSLKSRVEDGKNIQTLTEITDETSPFRFVSGENKYCLFYPVEETEQQDENTDTSEKVFIPDVIEKMKQKYGSVGEAVEYLAKDTKKLSLYLHKIGNEIQEKIEENKDASIVGGVSVVLGVRICGNQELVLITGETKQTMENIKKLVKSIK